MGTRAAVAAEFKKVLPRGFKIIDHPQDLGNLSGKVTAAVVIVRTGIKPAPNAQGSYLEEFAVWVVEPKTDDEGRSENSLDDNLNAVLLSFPAVSWMRWTKATRTMFGDATPALPAYKIDAEIVAEVKE